jgi:hypothetical protein
MQQANTARHGFVQPRKGGSMTRAELLVLMDQMREAGRSLIDVFADVNEQEDLDDACADAESIAEEVEALLTEAVKELDRLSRQPIAFDLVAHLTRQRSFSLRTFGPGQRTQGVCDHIRKELAEIEAAPSDLTEWVDGILLMFDGVWRSGHTPEQIVAAIDAKQTTNETRRWPDWRTADPNKAIEHVREEAV